MTIQELENKIIEASQAYYEGKPIMSDKDFDAYIAYLKVANPDSEILTTIGWGYDPFKQIGEKEEHLYGRITGIDRKPRSLDELPSDFKNASINDLFLSAKLDGLSMICYFVNGHFTKAITRGNGDTGINRTDKVQKILEKELIIPDNFDFTGAIRGEIVISHENWKEMLDKGIVTEDQNQRNVAAGIIGRDDILDDIKYIDLIFYKVVGFDSSSKYKTNELYHHNVLNGLHDCEFLSSFINPKYLVDYIVCDCPLTHELLEFMFTNRFSSKYLCDGVVITSKIKDLIGVSNKFNSYIQVVNNEVAYKFITESAITIIENIRWKMSKGNKAIPVINVTPVELSGATVSNATAFNAKYIYDNDLDIGSEVELIRSGEVIPYITKVISGSNGSGRKKLDEMVCPYCGTKLTWDGVDLVCKNKECANRDEQNLRVWVNNLGLVDGMSETLIKSFFDELNINSLDDLYNGSYEQFMYPEAPLNTHKGKFNLVLNRLFNEPIDLKNLLVALNIKSLGVKNAAKLVNSEFTSLLQEYLDINDAELFLSEVSKKMPAIVGPALTNNICSLDGISKIKNSFYVKDRIDFNVTVNAADEKQGVCVTGKLSVPRKEFEEFLNDNGYELMSSVSKNTKILITDNPDSGSSKNIQADKLGIPKMTEEEFRNSLDNFKYSNKYIL